MSKNPSKCSQYLCENILGPDALYFHHGDTPAGGICEMCLGDTKKLRVVLEKKEEKFEVTESVPLS